jgi:hypothetical protein
MFGWLCNLNLALFIPAKSIILVVIHYSEGKINVLHFEILLMSLRRTLFGGFSLKADKK